MQPGWSPLWLALRRKRLQTGLDRLIILFVWFQKEKVWRYADDIAVCLLSSYVTSSVCQAACVWLVAVYIWYIDPDIFPHHFSARWLFNEARVAPTAGTTPGAFLAAVRQTTCESRCKAFVEKLLFVTRHICMVSFCMKWSITVYSHEPGAVLPLRAPRRFFCRFLSSQWMGGISIGPVYVKVLPQKNSQRLFGSKMSLLPFSPFKPHNEQSCIFSLHLPAVVE